MSGERLQHLIERTMLTLAHTGVRRFRIVVGAHHERVERTLRGLPHLRDLSIEFDAPGGPEVLRPFDIAEPAVASEIGDASVGSERARRKAGAGRGLLPPRERPRGPWSVTSWRAGLPVSMACRLTASTAPVGQ